MCARSLQFCLTLCNPMDCSLPGSSVHWISQARILELAPIYSSWGSSQPRYQTHVSCVSYIAGRSFSHWATKSNAKSFIHPLALWVQARKNLSLVMWSSHAVTADHIWQEYLSWMSMFNPNPKQTNTKKCTPQIHTKSESLVRTLSFRWQKASKVFFF